MDHDSVSCWWTKVANSRFYQSLTRRLLRAGKRRCWRMRIEVRQNSFLAGQNCFPARKFNFAARHPTCRWC